MNERMPYVRLGKRIRFFRESARESLADVSDAVEIEAEKMQRIEQGLERPSEEIIDLLISHFKIREEEADNLWELAGYNQEDSEQHFGTNDITQRSLQPAVLIMPIDARIVYSDTVHVTVNNHGVVINFMQGAGSNSIPIVISRIGMSKEHARSVLKVLKNTLDQHDNSKQPPKQLDTP